MWGGEVIVVSVTHYFLLNTGFATCTHWQNHACCCLCINKVIYPLFICFACCCGPITGKNYKTTSGKKVLLTIQCLARHGCSQIYLTFRKDKVQYQKCFPFPYPQTVVIEKFCVTVQFSNQTEG